MTPTLVIFSAEDDAKDLVLAQAEAYAPSNALRDSPVDAEARGRL